ncbi:MAG: glycoside hydrolase [Chitinophagaceae bacterium]|nr:glycoside hydrolase [Chitinophagaceae bacterium]
MKTVNAVCVLTFLISLKSLAGDINDFNRHFRILPQPQKIELLKAKGLLYSDLRSVALINTGEKPVMTGMLEALPLTKIASAGTISLIIQSNLSLPSPEGYVLEINGKQVTIKASQQAGLFYGIQTLNQLLEDSHDQQLEIPSCKITDYPEIPYRAIHLDLKHHLDAGRYYYDMVDRLAAVKINAIIVEFEDKLRYRKAPVVGAPNAISIEEFAALSNYASDRFIEISPLVQGLGHASFILKHEEYKKLRDDSTSDWVFDPLNPATYDLQFSLYEDAIAATPNGRYLHVGGDEVGALGKSELSKKSGMKPIELQMHWLKEVSDFAESHHRIPIFWDDMVFKLAGLYETTYDSSIKEPQVKELWEKNQGFLNEKIPIFPKNCVYMRWNYDDAKLPGNRNALDWYKKNGLHAMAATAAQTMWPMLPRNRSNFQAIKDFCQLTSEKKLDGILCTVWDDCSVHLETVWRGLYDFALFSWNYEDIPVEKAHETFRHRFYAPGLAAATNDFQDLLEDALPFWETAFLREGDRNNYHKDFKLIETPDPQTPGNWNSKYKAKLELAAKAVKEYEVINNKIKNAMQLARRNDYALSVMSQVNELQVYPAKLLLLLQVYDKAPVKNKAKAIQQIEDYTDSFKKLRAQFEKTYAQTRIMGNPEGYQLDSNFHEHLANGTNNTDWMFMYEMPVNKQVDEWLAPQKAKAF